MIPFSKIKKSVLTNLTINQAQFFADHLFKIFLKKYTNKSSKKLGPIFSLPPFPNNKKNILTNLKKTWPNFLLIPFSNIKKGILTNLKRIWPNLLLIPFSNIKKGILANLKKPGPIFAYSLFKYYKS